jgi:hypothetical protein
MEDRSSRRMRELVTQMALEASPEPVVLQACLVSPVLLSLKVQPAQPIRDDDASTGSNGNDFRLTRGGYGTDGLNGKT